MTELSDLRVARRGEGELTVTWTLEDEQPVRIATASSPEAAQSARGTVVEGASQVVVGVLPRRRTYVSVATLGGERLVAAERSLPLQGCHNFRDLGGYPVVGGGAIRWGLVFRSDALHALTPADVAVIEDLGLRSVFDLRRPTERVRAPSILGREVSSPVELTIGGRAGHGRELIDRIFAGEIGRLDESFLDDGYRLMSERDAPAFATLLSSIAEDGALPTLFHCTAGKDRTGLAAALLLSVLGVSREHVLDDYALSQGLWSDGRMRSLAPRFAAAGLDIEDFRPLFSAPRSSMGSLLDHLDERHGSAERYLIEGGGMAPDVTRRLRRKLVGS